jgi:hypothetical protein
MKDLTPAPGDYEMRVLDVRVRGGTLRVSELTLRQRDRVSAMLGELASDAEVEAMFSALAGRKEGEEVSVDVVPFVRGVSAKVGTGALTRFLAAAVDLPENRAAFGGLSAEEWVLDNVVLSDEVRLLEALGRVNDLAAYLGNLFRTALTAARLRAETKAAPEA